MKKIIILIPVYNDWQSLIKLLDEINYTVKNLKGFLFDCIIINDASTQSLPPLKKPKNFNSLKVLNMKKNQGHAKCNAFGIRYIIQNENFDNLILMDGDGEDRPEEIQSLIDKIQNNPQHSVVARRVKRSEGFFFQFLYNVHKLLLIVLTGKNINFGNYTCLIKSDVKKIYDEPSLWNSFSGTIKKKIKDYKEIESIRGLRYFGPSKMSFLNLLLHSFSIIAVFKYQVFLRSAIAIFVIYFLKILLGSLATLLIIFIIFLCLLIFLISFRESKKELIQSKNNLDNIKIITH